MENIVDRLNRQMAAVAKTLAKLDAPLRSQRIIELLIMLEKETKGEDYDFRGTYLGVIQDVAQLMESELAGFDPHSETEEWDPTSPEDNPGGYDYLDF